MLTMTDKQRFSSVWDAIEDTPQEAASMRARSSLMMSLTEVSDLDALEAALPKTKITAVTGGGSVGSFGRELKKPIPSVPE